jgi:hypothetical protein
MNSNDKVMVADGVEISGYCMENSPKVITAHKQNALLETPLVGSSQKSKIK